MEDVNRRALFREVYRSQAISQALRTAIMVASQYCTFSRWVPYHQEDTSIIWEHESLQLRESLKTPFSRELDGDRALLRRVQAVHTVISVKEAEKTRFTNDTSIEHLREASLAFAELIPALQTIVWHAQEYGACWDWLKTEQDSSGTEKFIASHLDEVLLERSLGQPTDTQYVLRARASDWLKKAKIVYIGDDRRPLDRPALHQE